MTSRTIPQPPSTAEKLILIRDAPEHMRRALIGDFLADHAEDRPHVAAIARRRYSMEHVPLDDAIQTVAQCELELLEEIIAGKHEPETIRSWPRFMTSYVRNAFKVLARDHETTPMTPSRHKRIYRAESIRNRLRVELGREPTDEEIIKRGDEMITGHKDSSRSQNLRLTKDDLAPAPRRSVPWHLLDDQISDPSLRFDPPDDGLDVAEQMSDAELIRAIAPKDPREFFNRLKRRIGDLYGPPARKVADLMLAASLQEPGAKRPRRAHTPEEAAQIAGVELRFVREVQMMLREETLRIRSADLRSAPELLARAEEYARRYERRNEEP